MQATIFGVTHKNTTYKGDAAKKEFESQKKLYTSVLNSNCLYNEKSSVTDSALNYLNFTPENSIAESVRNIILKEFYDCEKIYPFLGDVLLELLFRKELVKISRDSFMYSRKKQQTFIDGLVESEASLIAEWLFKNTNLKRSVSVEKYNGQDVVFEMLNNFTFNLDYDFDFIKNKEGLTLKNYRYIIVDGYIESIGEIHHLLYLASQNKEPYVIFCFGMSEEVKRNIIVNNLNQRFTVIPVSLNSGDKNNLNVLNDLSALHGSSVISSQLGQTISIEVRKDLPKAKKIQFFKSCIIIDSNVDSESIKSHRNFLKNRLDEALSKVDVDIDPIKKRLRSFSANRINLWLPEKFLNTQVSRELDYFFRFVSHLKYPLKKVNISSRKNYFAPESCIKTAIKKVEVLHNIINNVEIIIA